MNPLLAENFKTDGNGEIIIETDGLEPGIYYIGAAGGFREGSGVPDSAGFVSNGAEGGPAYFKLTVAAVEQPDQPTEPEDPTEPSEPDQEKDTVIRQEKLDADSLEKKEELKAAGYDTVEKIENKLFKEMTAQVDYVVTKDNTTIYVTRSLRNESQYVIFLHCIENLQKYLPDFQFQYFSHFQ